QLNDQCSCFLSMDMLKTHPAHLAVFMFHVVSQFDPAPLNLRVSVPEDLALELEKRRPELIPEDLLRQYVHTVQDKVYPEVQKLLEDFRQKRSMGLTLAESELAKLDAERSRERQTLEKERLCAEPILQKIDEILLASQPPEEEKW
ncbi:hypothetical protein AB205_0000800, partial [Aquarana catesbeiana]